MSPTQIVVLVLELALKLAGFFRVSNDELKAEILKQLDKSDFASDSAWAEHEQNLKDLG